MSRVVCRCGYCGEAFDSTDKLGPHIGRCEQRPARPRIVLTPIKMPAKARRHGGSTATIARSTGEVHAIPTTYKGVQFRSRLEARWAVFFDTAGIPWQYEPEAFGDGATGYLPDFWLPDQDCYVEIKPDDNYSYDKVELVYRATGKDIFVLCGPIGSPGYSYSGCECISGKCEGFRHGSYWDNFYFVTQCPVCGRLDFTFSGWGRQLKCDCGVGEGKGGDEHSPRLHDAYRAAQTYRFWDPS